MFLHLLPKPFKKSIVLHGILILTFIITGILILPLLIITYLCFWKVNKKLYHSVIYFLSYTIWCQFTFISQWWGRMKIRLYIDDNDLNFLGSENALVILNHKYDIDWIVGWLMAEQYGCLGGTAPFVKEPLKHIPIIGWTWRFNGAVFLKRNWEKDKTTIASITNDLDDYPENFKKFLLLYPEGTRFTEEKLISSNKFALSKEMEPLKHCLLPRTRGFVEIVRALNRNVKVVYDMTLAFPSAKHGHFHEPTLFNALCGDVDEAHVLLKRYSIDELPIDSDKDLSSWLYRLFYEKDKNFDFFQQNGNFNKKSFVIQSRYTDMIVAESLHTLTAVLLIVFFKMVFLNWALSTIVLFIGLLSFCLFVVYLMINVTKTETGSSYGK